MQMIARTIATATFNTLMFSESNYELTSVIAATPATYFARRLCFDLA
jgi:hypothetical protein